MKDENYVISFSGGRTSAFMTVELLKDAKYKDAHVLFCNTGKENPATLDYVMQVSCYIYKQFGKIVTWLEYCPVNKFKVVYYRSASRMGEPFAALIEKRKFVPNVVTRFCTTELKIRPIKHYLRSIGIKNWISFVGIRYDEPRRYRKVKAHKDAWENEYPLVKWKISKPDVLHFWHQMPFDLNLDPVPEIAEIMGNCDFCHLKGLFKRMMIARKRPDIPVWWDEQEQLTGATFQKGLSIKQIVAKANEAELFTPPQFDTDFECFCNTD